MQGSNNFWKKFAEMYSFLVLKSEDAYLEPYQIPMMELFCKNSKQQNAVDYFCKKLHGRCLIRFLKTLLVKNGLQNIASNSKRI